MSAWKAGVFALLLVNAVYFLWNRGFAGPRTALPSAPPATSLQFAPAAPPAAAAGAAAPPAGGVGGGAAAAAAAAVHNGAPSALLTDVKRCITIGPFPDVAEAAHAAATLRGGGYEPRQRVMEGEVWSGVWVYLPLPATAAAADQMRAKLKSGGIDDALEMPGPNDKPVISLGLFSEARRAQARVAQAQALGLNPGIADRKRSGDVYWVDIDLKPTDSIVNPSDLEGETGRIVRLEVKGCPIAENTPS